MARDKRTSKITVKPSVNPQGQAKPVLVKSKTSNTRQGKKIQVNDQNGNRKFPVPKLQKSNGGIGGIISNVIDVVGDSISIAEGNPVKIAEIPNTIMKVIDTGKEIVKNLSGENLPQQKVVLDKTQEITGQNQKVVNELKKHMPTVDTIAIPSTYLNEVSLPPMKESARLENGVHITNIQGSNIPYAITSQGTTGFINFQAGRVTPITSLNGILGYRCNNMAQLFQKWRLNSIGLQSIPTQGNNDTGNVYFILNNGADFGALASVSTNSQVSQYENKKWGHASGRVGLNLDFGKKGKWLWVNPKLGGYDMLWYSQWVWAVYLSGIEREEGAEIAQLCVTFDIDFCQATPEPSYYLDAIISDIRLSWLDFAPVHVNQIQWIKIFGMALELNVNKPFTRSTFVGETEKVEEIAYKNVVGWKIYDPKIGDKFTWGQLKIDDNDISNQMISDILDFTFYYDEVSPKLTKFLKGWDLNKILVLLYKRYGGMLEMLLKVNFNDFRIFLRKIIANYIKSLEEQMIVLDEMIKE